MSARRSNRCNCYDKWRDSAACKKPQKLCPDFAKAHEYRRIFGSRGLWLAVRTKLTSNARVERAPIPGEHTINIRLNSSDLATFTKVF